MHHLCGSQLEEGGPELVQDFNKAYAQVKPPALRGKGLYEDTQLLRVSSGAQSQIGLQRSCRPQLLQRSVRLGIGPHKRECWYSLPGSVSSVSIPLAASLPGPPQSKRELSDWLLKSRPLTLVPLPSPSLGCWWGEGRGFRRWREGQYNQAASSSCVCQRKGWTVSYISIFWACLRQEIARKLNSNSNQILVSKVLPPWKGIVCLHLAVSTE